MTKSINDNQNFIFNTKFDAMTVAITKGLITVTVKPSFFNEQDIFRTGAADALVVAEATLSWYPAATQVQVVVLDDFTDTLGKTTTEPATIIDITKATGATFTYSGLRDRMESGDWWLMYYDADGYYIHPAVWKNLSSSDEGSLLTFCNSEPGYC